MPEKQIANDIPDWIQSAKKLPLAFSQVREDPFLDEWLLNQCHNDHQQIVMIASGGCTAAYLAAKKNVAHIDLVDTNPAQLGLTQFKLHLLEHYRTEERLRILGHRTMNAGLRYQHLSQWLSENNHENSLLGDLDQLSQFGPDYMGRYELLFKALQQELLLHCQQITSLLNQKIPMLPLAPNLTESIESAIKKVMSTQNLITLFGEDATQNPAKPFYQHFIDQTFQLLLKGKTANNPYLTQFLQGRYVEDQYAPWLNLKQQSITADIKFHCMEMSEALEKILRKNDLIHLSNILDWLSKKEAKELLTLAKSKLKKNGFIIIRQLNSSLNIRELGGDINWLRDESKQLTTHDRSFFYKQIHVGR